MNVQEKKHFGDQQLWGYPFLAITLKALTELIENFE